MSILLAGLLLLYFLFFIKRKHPVKPARKKPDFDHPFEKAVSLKQKPPPAVSVKEFFDYGKIRIMHDNGIYTVNDGGRVMTFKSWRYLPPQYQQMVKQVDSGSLAKSKSGYFMDNINGVYFVTTPDGKKKKYSSLNDIPAEIRKLLSS